jgi:hypothetical protein
MSRLARGLCLAASSVLWLSPLQAEARFGKKSPPEEVQEQKEHAASPRGQEGEHAAGPSTSGRQARGPSVSVRVETWPVDGLVALWSLLAPPVRGEVSVTTSGADVELESAAAAPPAAAPPAAASPEEVPPAAPMAAQPVGERATLTVNVEGQGFRQGGGAGGVSGTLEGARWGLDARTLLLVLPTEDGTSDADGILLAAAHLTYSLVAEDWMRLRLQAGVNGVMAPDLSAWGPGLGASMELCVLGPLDLEARANVIPFPFAQLDAQAGLALRFPRWSVRAGVRRLVLDDRGLVDGTAHVDRFTGPYVGLAMHFD